jgi:hypothetical protein
MSARAQRAWLASFVVLQLFMACGVSVLARRGALPSSVVVGVALSFLPYLGAVFFSRALPSSRASTWAALAASAVVGGAYLFAPPTLSDDVFRYLWEGRLWLEGLNPYETPPDDPSLSALRDEAWARINNKPLASIYPPLAQGLFLVAAALGGQAWVIKLFALSLHLLALVLVSRVSDDQRAPWLLGLNPLLLCESALNAHFDIGVGAALLLAAWSLGRSRWLRAGVATCAAVGLKAIGLLIVPLFWRKPRAMLVAAAGAACLLAPMLLARSLGSAASGPGQFATRWRGNESFFALVEWLSRLALPEEAAGYAARAFVALLVLALVAVVVRRRLPALDATRVIVWGVLLLSPQVHPWYLGWLLPLEVAAGSRAALCWSAAILLAYAPLDAWVSEGVWAMPFWLQGLEYGVLLLAWISDPRRPSLGRPPSRE